MSRTAVIVSDAEDSRALCRLCMIYHEYFVNIFIPNDTFRICAEEAIHDLLRLKVAVGDGLPSNICHQCVNKIMEFRDFKEMCLKTAEELRKYDMDYVLRSYAKEEFGSSENALVVKEEVNDGEHRIEGDVPVNALTSVAVDPLAVDTMAIKYKAQEPKGTAGDGNCLSDISPHSHIQVTEVFVPVPDQLSMGIASPVVEDWRPAELMVNEEIGDGVDCIGNGVPVVTLSSVNVDPLAVDTTALKEEAQEPNGDMGEGNSLGDTGPHNQIQVFVPVPDQLAMGFVSHVEEDWWPAELMVNEEIGDGVDCIGNGVPVVTLSSVNVDPLAVDTTALKEEAQEPNGDAGKRNSLGDKCPHNHIQMTEVFAPVPDQLAMGIGCDVEKDLRRTALMDKEEIGKGLDCSENDVPKGSLSTVNVDPLVVDTESSVKDDCMSMQLLGEVASRNCNTSHHYEFRVTVIPNNMSLDLFALESQVDRSNNIAGLVRDPENRCDEFVVDRQWTSQKEVLNNPVVVHTGVKAFTCDECRKMFARKFNLIRHLLVHTSVKPFKCNECEKTFSTRSELNTHSVVHTGVKPFKCSECGKMFTQKCHLNAHSVVHTGVKPFKCNECGKMFSTSSYLKTHSVVHTGLKAFKCNDCGKMFKQKNDLKSHSVVHTGVKPFKCDECGKMFTRNSSLITHSVVHTGVKSFKCNECGKMFFRSSDLRTHSVVHTGVKRVKCDECGKRFTTSSHLKRHSVIHTGVKPFKCDLCGEQFKWISGFSRHLITHADRSPSK